MGFGFSGYLLPWNTLAFFATKVGTEIAGQVPIIGKPMMIFSPRRRRGDWSHAEQVLWIPRCRPAGLVTVLIAIHLFLVQRQGISVPPKLDVQWTANPSARREMKFFPNFMLREMMAWYVAMGVLGALAAIFPWNLGVKQILLFLPGGNQAGMVLPLMFQTLKVIPSKVWFVDGEVLGVRRLQSGRAWCGCCCLSLRVTIRTHQRVDHRTFNLCPRVRDRYERLWPTLQLTPAVSSRARPVWLAGLILLERA